MKFLLIIFLTMLSMVSAKEIEFCFNDPTPISRARDFTKEFLLPDESVSISSNDCIVASVAKHRIELIRKVVAQKYPEAIVQHLGEEISTGRMCEMIIEEESQFELDNTEVGITVGLGVKATRDQEKQSRQSTMLVSEGKYASIVLNGTMMILKCIRLAPNPIVEIYYQTIDSGISTTLTFPMGTKREIGSVIEDLAGKQKNLNLDKGISLQMSEGHKSKVISLTVKAQIERH